jgi:predicted AAA+ superfamily ATPase
LFLRPEEQGESQIARSSVGANVCPINISNLSSLVGMSSWGAKPAARRFEALHAGSLTALVGREKETELLLQCWSRAKSDQGQVVLLSGEAGIGKSRLTAALLEAVTEYWVSTFPRIRST